MNPLTIILLHEDKTSISRNKKSFYRHLQIIFSKLKKFTLYPTSE